MSQSRLGRRRLLTGALGWPLVLGIASGGCRLLPGGEPVASPPTPPPAPLRPAGAPGDEPLLSWLTIAPDSTVTISLPRAEMGQGVRTALAMLVAEELAVDWSAVRVETAPAAAAFGRQLTAGSESIRQLWQPLRLAGATARTMLIEAAAERWGVAATTLTATAGQVREADGRRLAYGELVAAAASRSLPPPERIALKPAAAFTLIGRPQPGIDGPAIVTGTARYGLDVRQPGGLFAVVARPPSIGGRLVSVDPAPALAVAGVRRVVTIPSGVVVVAETTWAALMGRAALRPVWAAASTPAIASEELRTRLRAAASLPQLADTGGRVVTADYELPLLAHAPMEPLNATATVGEGRATLWVPTQDPQAVQAAVAAALALPPERVTVQVTLMGGGFGRRVATDDAVEAAQVAAAVGVPVQVVWSREDDLRHDRYRPASHHRLRAVLRGGRIARWEHRLASSGLDGVAYLNERFIARTLTPPYAVGRLVTAVRLIPAGVPTGFWRSVYSSQSVFATESFIDELAAAGGHDPLTYRLGLITEPRLRAVLTTAAAAAGWGQPLPPGRGRGIAGHAEFGSFIAQVVEVTVDAAGAVRVDRVICAVDCGQVVNPSGVEAQIQGAVNDGLATALRATITVANGRVVQGSWAEYPWLRLNEAPPIAVIPLASAAPPGGVGELGYPALPPALANAITAATGRRPRRLPIAAE